MLRKLIKQEFKASYKLIVFVQLLTLILAVLGRFIFTNTIFYTNPNEIQMVLGATFSILYIGFVFIISFACQIYVAIRFYRSLFSSQGYLSFTLPVTPTQLLHSKLIVAVFWGVSTMVIIVIAVFISCYTPAIATLFQTAILASNLAISYIIKMILYAIGTTVLGTISGYLMMFSCICIGQLFNKNRIVASIITYGIMTTILQIITTVIAFATSFTYTVSTTTQNADMYATNYYAQTFSQTAITSIVIGIATYIVCHYIMNKKLNLV